MRSHFLGLLCAGVMIGAPIGTAASAAEATPIALQSLSFLNLKSADLERSVEFYHRVFGFRVATIMIETAQGLEVADSLDVSGIRGVILAGAFPLVLVPTPANGAARSDAIVPTFQVADADRAFTAAGRLGVRILKPVQRPQGADGMAFFLIADPDGTALDIIEFPKGKASVLDLGASQHPATPAKESGPKAVGGGGRREPREAVMDKINRRSVLLAGVASAVGAGVARGGRAAAPKGPTVSKRLPDFVVIGAGAFGAFTALNLVEQGARVTLVDAYGPGNPLASSSDDTRQFRCAYGSREMYTQWAVRALELWKQRETEWGRQLFVQSGMLNLLSGWTDELHAQCAVFDRAKLPYEILDLAEMIRRFPQINFSGTISDNILPQGALSRYHSGGVGLEDPQQVRMGFYEPGAGLLKAREAMVATVDAFCRKGGTLRINWAVPGRKDGRRLLDVDLGGESLSSGSFVFACGPWLPKVFPAQLGDKILTPRVEMLYFRSPINDGRFRAGNMPTLNDAGGFTQPDLNSGFKCNVQGETVLIDPDEDDRIVSAYKIHRSRLYLRARVPALADQPIVASRVCQAEMTRNEHFIIDHHPDYDNLLIAGGGSGHGFKHAPMTGQYISQLLLGAPGDEQWRKDFSIAGREGWT